MQFIGEFAALFTAVLWSGSSMVFAAATARIGSIQVNISRLLMATIYLGIVILLFGLPVALSARQAGNLAVSGIVGLALGDSFLFKAYKEIGARVTMLIMSLAPAVTAVLGYIFLNETISLQAILGMIITIVGIAIVVLERRTIAAGRPTWSFEGLALAVLAAVGQGVGLIFAKLAFREGEMNGFVATFIRILSSLVLLVPGLLMTGRWANPVRVFSRDRKALLLTAAGSVLGPFLGISFSLIAISHTDVAVAATLMATVPILMLPLVHIFHHEHLSWKSIAGAFVTVLGVGLLFFR
jgi:drug/metabolite transporter (DMT)-like permease